jgi:hypothetical protein
MNGRDAIFLRPDLSGRFARCQKFPHERTCLLRLRSLT